MTKATEWTRQATGAVRQPRTADFAGQPEMGRADGGSLMQPTPLRGPAKVVQVGADAASHEGRERLEAWLAVGEDPALPSMQEAVAAFLAREGAPSGLSAALEGADRVLAGSLIDRIVDEAFAEGSPETYFHVILWAADAHATLGNTGRTRAMSRLAVDMADWMQERGLDPLARLAADGRQAFGEACRVAMRHPRPDVRVLAEPLSGSQAMDRPTFVTHVRLWLAWLLMGLLGNGLAAAALDLLMPVRQARVVAVQPTDKAQSAARWLERLAVRPVDNA